MQIVTQSATPSHSLFPPPRLALPAPKIAGLLPAHVGADPRVSPPPPANDALRLHEPRLAQLTTLEYARVFTAFRQLVTAAVDFTLGESLSAELYAAEQAFHATLTGESAAPTTRANPGLKQRLDAFWKESEVRMAAAERRSAARIEALRRKYNIEPEIILPVPLAGRTPGSSSATWDEDGEGGAE